MAKIKNNLKKDGIIVKNIYNKKEQDTKIKDILLKSYKIFLQKELKEGDKCLYF